MSDKAYTTYQIIRKIIDEETAKLDNVTHYEVVELLEADMEARKEVVGSLKEQ